MVPKCRARSALRALTIYGALSWHVWVSYKTNPLFPPEDVMRDIGVT
jgi:hypothetical protein